MPALYKDTGYTLRLLVEEIKVGQIALPDIQRPFVWSAAKARDLFDSMYRGYPVGTIMLWETGASVGTRQIGLDESARTPTRLIVDGQQRLTSLFSVLTGQPVLTKTFAEKKIKIAFRPSDETFEVADAAIELDPEFIPDITALWSEGYRPTVRAFLKRLRAARNNELSEDEEDRLEERVNRVHDLEDFRFQVVELGATADEEQVAEVFVRINSEGVNLKQADFILTLMSVHWEAGRQQLEQFSRAAVDPKAKGANPKNPFIEPSSDQMLRVGIALAFKRARLQHVYSILRGKDLETGSMSDERRVAQFEALASAQEKVLDLGNWHEFLKCLPAAGFQSRKMITAESSLLFSYAFWLIGRFDFGLSQSELRPVIARWFFMAHTTSRYSTSGESQMESDLDRLQALPRADGAAFVDELDRIIRSNFTNDYWEITLPNRLDTSAAKSPALSAYIAALSLLDAEVLFSDVRVNQLLDPSVSAPRSIERHHLFPKKYLASQGITDKQVDAIANMAMLDWAENAKISDSGPVDYWTPMSEAIPAARRERQIHLHALPVGWEQLDYQTFLKRRRDLIAQVVRKGFETLWGGREESRDESIEALIDAGESQILEFKSTARWNLHTKQKDSTMEHVIVKVVASLLNAEGGNLLIGIDDQGTPLGLDDDFSTLGSRANADGFELFLRQLLDNCLSATTASTVRVRFPVVQGSQICQVTVAASGRPVFAKPQDGRGAGATDFWVRIGNATKQLHGDDMINYQSDHWG